MPFQATSERIESLDKGSRNAFILQNPTTASLYFANRYKDEFSLADLEAFLTALEPTDRQSSLAKRIESYLRAKKLGPVSVGKKIIDFQLVDVAGNLIPILNPTRTPKLISLFSSSCQFSIASIKLLAELNELNQGQLELVTIWTDESRDTWLNAFKDHKAQITWTNLWDGFGFAQTYLDLKAWPTFYLVNEEGVLTEKFSNSKSMGKKMKGLLK